MLLRLISTSLLFAVALNAVPQGRDIRPEDPAEAAKSAQVQSLIQQARGLIRNGNLSQSIPIFQQAATVQATMIGFKSSANFELARTFVRLGRNADAIGAYRKVFRWNAVKMDLDVGTGPIIQPVMEYAILLSREGRSEDAKAIYYFGLRHLNVDDRTKEPIPFLIVFEPELEGIRWEYTAQRLEAVANMTMAMHGGTTDFATNSQTTPTELVSRVRELAPDWFYPVIFKAAKNWNSERGEQLLAQAEALARPGLERELVARYRVELAQHISNNDTVDTPLAPDMRPMPDGSSRRARMQCLLPNANVLRPLAL